jgi:ATP-dependent helicase Lhr and Lhr-like helicase
MTSLDRLRFVPDWNSQQNASFCKCPPSRTPMLDFFHPTVQTWFEQELGQPTRAQLEAWPAIERGNHTLVLAPTGSGKTLAAFLTAINRLMFERPSTEHDEAPVTSFKKPGVSVLYISPLKALGVDVERNLQRPLLRIQHIADEAKVANQAVTVAIRSGDTDPAERRRIAKTPPDILITTPESLYLILTSKAREILCNVDTIIIDEIHSLVASKRGSHLFVSLERLEELRRRSSPERPAAQRIGLSATQRPLDEVARLLGGLDFASRNDPLTTPRDVTIVEAGRKRQLDITIEVPVEDMSQLAEAQVKRQTGKAQKREPQPAISSIWPAIHPRLVELIRSHRSTMIFVNSRRLAERLAGAINDEADEEIALAHHGSLAKDARFEIESRLKEGLLPAIVATSSLELGIDMGAVDLVIQIAAPPSIASGLQRIGRSGHSVGAVSKGIIFPRYRGDLLACAAASDRMLNGEVEETFYPRNPLDVLAQQIVAVVSEGPIPVDTVYRLMLSSAPFADLPRSSYEGVLDLLSGRYPSDEFHELRPRINWDRISGELFPRSGSQRVAILNAGTIPDRGLYGVFLLGNEGEANSRVGELDEEMVHEIHPGDVFLLGASSWRVIEITQDRVLVVPAPGEPGRMPFWKGEGPGRPLEFGQAIGSLARQLLAMDREDALQQLTEHHGLADLAAENLLKYLEAQIEATGEIPSDRTIIVETGIDEVGDWRIVILSSFGARIHAPLASAAASRLREISNGQVDVMWTDEGIVFRLPAADEIPSTALLFPGPDEIEDILIKVLSTTALFASHFRENAARALLLPRQRPGKRTPLWLQRRKSADLLTVAARYPSFPMMLETYRECLKDVFDLPGLKTLLEEVQNQAIVVRHVQTESPSPFASASLFSFTGNFLYDGDAPLAERRAQALALDHLQLQELLGEVNYSELLDPDVLRPLRNELQRLHTQYPVRSVDGLHDLLLYLGDLSRDEIADRCDMSTGPPSTDEWIASLLDHRRIVQLTIAGTARFVAAEDASRYRDALSIQLPSGIATALLEPVDSPLTDVIARFARTHGPFSPEDVCARFNLQPDSINTTLIELAQSGRLIAGDFTTQDQSVGSGTRLETDTAADRQWCDANVLRIWKQRSLARVREQIKPASSDACTRFLIDWHGIGRRRKGPEALLDVVEQIQGLALPASCLERDILSARLQDYRPGELDELCATGEVLWQGRGKRGSHDGRVALFLSEVFDHLTLPPPPDEVEDELADRLRAFLTNSGAVFFNAIHAGVGGFRNDVVDTLWKLVWNGEVTNDTLAPVRSLTRSTRSAAPSRSGQTPSGRRVSSRRSGRARPQRPALLPGTEGRWSLLRIPDEATFSPTERKMEQVRQLLDRMGIVTRESVAAENIDGGFSAIYPILRALEDSGQIRRGYFIEGLGAAQFAAPGADERLRHLVSQEETGNAKTVTISAVDPANPFGSVISWPALAGRNAAKPQRTSGALVFIRSGFAIGYLNRGFDSLTTFRHKDSDQPAMPNHVADVIAELAGSRGPILLTSIDGHPAQDSDLAPEFLAAGFQSSSSGLRHRGI